MTNVLFIAADDLCHVGRMLSVLIQGFDLPNLRRLMNEGTDFDRAYCVVPVCEPARTAVMSGLSPADTRSFDLTVGWKDILQPENLWTYQLRKAGYHMTTGGKVFHGYVPQPQYVYDRLYDDTRFDFPFWKPEGEPTEHGGEDGQGWDNDTDWYDKYLADKVINHIQTYNGTAPWYAECGFYKPHTPYIAPNRIFDSIDMNNVIIPADWQGGFDMFPFYSRFMVEADVSKQSSDPANWTAQKLLDNRLTIRNYAAAALWMDEQLGRILDALELSAFANNTIVTFYSDHGYHLSDHDKFHKFTLYEQTACAPMAIRVPGQTPRKVESPVSHMDLGATILDLCGVPIPHGHRGVSLRPWIEGQTPPERVIPTFWYGSVSVASGSKRVTLNQDGTSEMYDIVADPWAKTNIATTDPSFSALRDAALDAAADWGFLLVEQALDTSRSSPLQSFLGTHVTPSRISTSFVAMGDFNSPKGRSPGYQRMWSAAFNSGATIRMPPHVEDYSAMGLRANNIVLHGNALNNVIRPNGHGGEVLTVYLGEGDDEIENPGSIKVIAYGGPGNDLLRAGSGGPSTLCGDGGNDTLEGSNHADTIHGGAGDDVITGAGGADRIFTGPGDDTVDGQVADDLITADGGSNVLTGGDGADTFIIKRTGMIQTITDLTSADTLDLSDWAAIQPVSVVQDGSNVIVSAALERIVCQNATVATVQAAITGAIYA